MSLYDQIPEYKKAAERERDNRELAFCGLPVPVCGLLSNLLTPAIYSRLHAVENAFVVGKKPEPEDVACLLWFISIYYSLDSGERHRFVKHHVSKVLTQRAAPLAEIYEYLAMCFQDAPMVDVSASGFSKSYTSGMACIVDLLASEYGWSEREIVNMPMPRIYQYIRRIQLRHNPSAPMINPSDAVISRWLQARNSNN